MHIAVKAAIEDYYYIPLNPRTCSALDTKPFFSFLVFTSVDWCSRNQRCFLSFSRALAHFERDVFIRFLHCGLVLRAMQCCPENDFRMLVNFYEIVLMLLLSKMFVCFISGGSTLATSEYPKGLFHFWRLHVKVGKIYKKEVSRYVKLTLKYYPFAQMNISYRRMSSTLITLLFELLLRLFA